MWSFHPCLNFFATFFFQEKKVEEDYVLKYYKKGFNIAGSLLHQQNVAFAANKNIYYLCSNTVRQI